jgi:hypothetical protein
MHAKKVELVEQRLCQVARFKDQDCAFQLLEVEIPLIVDQTPNGRVTDPLFKQHVLRIASSVVDWLKSEILLVVESGQVV